MQLRCLVCGSLLHWGREMILNNISTQLNIPR